MAARTLKPRHQEEVKLKIQTTQLVNVLQNHALGHKGHEDLPQSRIDAAKTLLARTLPVLSAVEQTTISEDEKLDDNQILAKLSALIEQYPDIVQQALALKARQSTAPLPDTTIKPDIKAA
jgi:hypothetical protein